MFSLFDGWTPSRSAGQSIAQAAMLFEQARRVLVITGAGMSADSGLPTYRGIGGLYDRDITEDGLTIEEALSIDTFRRDPALTWKYVGQIERACRGAAPNDGHRTLASLAERYERLCVLTQNVDGFHAAAGSRDVIEMHGNIHRLRCEDCGDRQVVEDYSRLGPLPPSCAACGGLVRPAVVLFGEMLPGRAVARYERALADGFDLVVTIGTSAVFPYIAVPVRDAWRGGGSTIEINPQATEISRLCHVTVRDNAAAALSEITRTMGAKRDT
ncbi:NAD-dependent deacylase [Salinisphaera sp. T31B1]|uniref:SIR2 family NAD-dependent protein deacylase n=1 Tax=Salinisphaera sp. T31B1 TaxID=727963 RepID=UPI0033427E98